MISDFAKYIRIYHRYIGIRIYIFFSLTTLMAFSEGLGFTMLLPLIRVVQPTTGREELSSGVQAIYDVLTWLGISDSLVGVLLVIVGIFFLKGLLQFAQTSYIGYLRADLLKKLKTDLFDGYSGMEYQHFIRQNPGHFINVINQQVNRFFRSFKEFGKSLTKAVSALSFFGFALVISWKFATMVVAVGCVVLMLFQFLNVYVQALSRRVSKEMSHLNKFLMQSLQAFKYIVSTNRTGPLRTKVTESIRKLTTDIFRQKMANALTKAIRQPVSVLVVSVVIVAQVMLFKEPLAPIFVALLLFHKGMQSIMALQRQWQSVMDQIGGVELVDEEMRSVKSKQESGGAQKVGTLSERIELQDVSFAYNKEDGDVLHDINITIPANGTVALVGESGAGKSTLIDMLTLLLEPRTGELRIDGVPHNEVDLDSWRSQIGYVSQESIIFNDTVANNICFWQGDIEEDPALRERVRDAAERAYADHFIRNLSDGYQTSVGDRGVRLSGGQRQRLFLARELFKNPDLLLLDEATSDLDTASENKVQDSIDNLQGDVTVVIIAHRLSTVRGVDQVYVLDEGRVIESGAYSELRSRQNGRFRKMMEMQGT
jgi:ABC-type multidrug transport system fused ATPase/permease subunit